MTVENNEDDDDNTSTSTSDLPPALLPGSRYDTFICGSCAASNATLKRYAGTPGVLMVTRDEPDGWKVIGEDGACEEQEVDIDTKPEASTNAGVKRARSLSPSKPTFEKPDAKRLRASPSSNSAPRPCLAPSRNPIAPQIYASLTNGDASLGAGDIFLTDGWRNRWCQCNSVRAFLLT